MSTRIGIILYTENTPFRIGSSVHLIDVSKCISACMSVPALKRADLTLSNTTENNCAMVGVRLQKEAGRLVLETQSQP